jgi:hypothetical protein
MNEGNNDVESKTRPGVPSPRLERLRRYRRLKIEEKLSTLSPVSIDCIIKCTNKFLEKNYIVRIPQVQDPIIGFYKGKVHNEEYVDMSPDNKEIRKIHYDVIKKCNKLNNKKHIVWMNFTTDHFLGVVGAGCDVGFGMPPSKEHYDDKKKNGKYIYSTAGVIVHYLGQKFDRSHVLLFPLANIDNFKRRGQIECGIGEYLISKGVPILDYKSHIY